MEIAVALARGAHFLAVLSVLGTLFSRGAILPAAAAGLDTATRGRVARRQRDWLAKNLIAAIVLGVVWLIVQSAEIAGAESVSATLAAVPVVLRDTVFGEAMLLRLGLLLMTALFARIGWLATLFAAAAAAEQVRMGHAMAEGGVILPMSVGLHVVAAGIWLGGLVPLALMIRDLPGARARAAAMRFSPIGFACVLVLAATAFVQGEYLVGGLKGFSDSGYGRVAELKLVLFAVLIVFAVVNRSVLAPRADQAPEPLLRNLSGEVLVGVATVITAAFLSQQMPGVDM